MNKILSGITVLSILSFVWSCKKGPGEGGNSSIHGTVNTITYMDPFFEFPLDTFPAADEDVFIIYGDDISFSDKTQTNFEGKFEFKYLREGDYKIYVYSEARKDSFPSGEVAVVKEVEINGKRKSIDAGLFQIKDE
jgi:hypothetical protein